MTEEQEWRKAGLRSDPTFNRTETEYMAAITPERLAEIRERIGATEGDPLAFESYFVKALRDLLAEIDRLNAALTAANERAEQAEAKNERLREALKIYAAAENWKLHGRLDPSGSCFVGQVIATRALGDDND